MVEWLILLLLVPAIVAPVVLLIGFAGCNQVFGLHNTVPQPPPIFLEAFGKSGSIITLTWQYGGSASSFEIERDGMQPFIPAPASPFDDIDLTPATSHQYRVRALLSDGDTSDWSASVTATTLPFETTFEETLTQDASSWEGFTLVQRIEAARLSISGTQVIITVQAHSMSGASIDRIYISQPDPNSQIQYDSISPSLPPVPGQLTKVFDDSAHPVMVPPGKDIEGDAVYFTFGPVTYTLDHTQPLLIAVDFSISPASGTMYAGPVPPVESVAYYFQYNVPNAPVPPEAAIPDRTPNYGASNNIYLIAKIEVVA